MFNMDIICPNCKDEERKHPHYEDAWTAENVAIKAKIKNFPGIGLPKDLIAKYKSRKVVCFHHLDGDGLCAAAIVKHFYMDYDIEVIFAGITYGQIPKWELINPDDTVVIVDYSFEEDQWPTLLNITKDIIWIDHHKTAIEKESNPHHVDGIRQNGLAGAQLTWNYYFPKFPTPHAVKLISDYDVWEFKYGDETRFFQRAIYNHDKHPESSLWEGLIKAYDHADIDADAMALIDELVKEGEILETYNYKQNKSLCTRAARWIDYKGYVCCVVNNQIANSMVFDSIDSDTYDIMAVFRFNGKQWIISFYSNPGGVDVSEIAKQLGGGGHHNASGCQVDILPFDFTQEDCKKVTDADKPPKREY
jgi:oligoribonuclease NrnB/cAMP/cGMP phosphodiesterase (DHH superfamily)